MIRAQGPAPRRARPGPAAGEGGFVLRPPPPASRAGIREVSKGQSIDDRRALHRALAQARPGRRSTARHDGGPRAGRRAAARRAPARAAAGGGKAARSSPGPRAADHGAESRTSAPAAAQAWAGGMLGTGACVPALPVGCHARGTAAGGGAAKPAPGAPGKPVARSEGRHWAVHGGIGAGIGITDAPAPGAPLPRDPCLPLFRGAAACSTCSARAWTGPTRAEPRGGGLRRGAAARHRGLRGPLRSDAARARPPRRRAWPGGADGAERPCAARQNSLL